MSSILIISTMEKYKFTTNRQWSRVRYRGFAVGVSSDQVPEGMWNPNDLCGQIVEIDGEDFICKGVEMFRINISPQRPYKLDFGLLVKEESAHT